MSTCPGEVGSVASGLSHSHRVMEPGDAAGPALSLVVPVHNEEQNLPILVAEVAAACHGITWEMIVVDDASTDASRAVARRVAASYPPVRVISLAARGGQSAALCAGLDEARGDLVATLDADLQNDPADLPTLVHAVRTGRCDAAVGVRVRRAASWWRRTQSRIANGVRNLITGDVVRDTGCSLRVIRRAFVLTLPRFDGMHRFVPTLLRHAGARVLEIPVHDRPRHWGKSKYGMWNRVFAGLRQALAVRRMLQHPPVRSLERPVR